jgi:hypothetical protein
VNVNQHHSRHRGPANRASIVRPRSSGLCMTHHLDARICRAEI